MNVRSVVILLAFLSYIEATPTYSVLASNIIRPHSDFSLIISLDDFQTETTVTCNLTKSIPDGSSGFYETRIFKPPNAIQVITMQPGGGQYDLTVKSTGSELSFNEVIKIDFVYKQYVILIQTDKAVYKPGQDVLFRVVVMDELLNPAPKSHINDIKIFLMDPNDVKLREFKLNDDPGTTYKAEKLVYSKGVLGGNTAFKLHEAAMTGEWKLQAVTNGQVQNYTFFVDEYTLPLANVTIDLPQFVQIDNPILDYKIHSLYTFGKPVSGNADITIEKIKDCGNSTTKTTHQFSKQMKGQLIGNLDLMNTPLLLTNCNEVTMNFSVNLFDDITKSVYSNYQTFGVTQTDIKAEILDKRSLVRPGHTIFNEVKLTSKSGQNIPKNLIKEYIICEVYYKRTNTEETVKGIVKFEISEGRLTYQILANDNGGQFSGMIFRVIYQNSTRILTLEEQTYNFATGCQADFLQLDMQSRGDELIVGQKINLIVSSNNNIDSLILVIIIKGSITLNGTYTFSDQMNMRQIPLSITKAMVPEALIVVYTKSKLSNSIISDSMKLSVSGIFQNQVNITTNAKTLDAGQMATFSVSAQPGSSLFFLGVDVSVDALRQGNDITRDRIIADIEANKNKFKEQADGFLQAGVTMRTNAKRECTTSYYIQALQQDYASNRGKGVNIRKDFRETWIWDKKELDTATSTMTYKHPVPDSITSWKITAFSVDEDKGLGVTTLPGFITVFRKLFLRLNLPYSIKRFEDTEIHIVVFNYMSQAVNAQVKVSLKNAQDSSIITIEQCDQNIQLAKNEIQTLSCRVTSKQVGKFGLIAEVTGTNMVTNAAIKPDRELRELVVHYEGIPQQINQDIYFDLTETTNNKLDYKIKNPLPTNRVIGSERLFMSATTDLITNIWEERLKNMNTNISYDITEPYGCCQQRMASGFPKIAWIEYLNMTKKIKPVDYDMAVRAVQAVMTGLCFIKNDLDGSFVDFEYTGTPSVWQTVYTLNMMWRAKNIVFIDDKVIFSTKNWLKSKAFASGEYRETNPNPLFYTGTNAYITSFVHTTLSETGEKNSVTVNWLASVFADLKHPLDIMSTCYALHVANSTVRDTCYEKVNKMMLNSSDGNYWVDSNRQPDHHLTAYGLMILAQRKSYSKALDTFKYLLLQQKSLGNSYNQVIVVEAMTKFISITKGYDLAHENLFVTFKTNNKGGKVHLTANTETAEVVEGDPLAPNILISAQGFGRAIARVNYQFYVNNFSANNDFDVGISKQMQTQNYLLLTICTSHKEARQINNTIVEIDLPSGYTYDEAKLTKDTTKTINRIESEKSGTHINVYLKKIHSVKFCFTIPAIESFNVKNRQPVPIKVYPYYDRTKLTITPITV